MRHVKYKPLTKPSINSTINSNNVEEFNSIDNIHNTSLLTKSSTAPASLHSHTHTHTHTHSIYNNAHINRMRKIKLSRNNKSRHSSKTVKDSNNKDNNSSATDITNIDINTNNTNNNDDEDEENKHMETLDDILGEECNQLYGENNSIDSINSTYRILVYKSQMSRVFIYENIQDTIEHTISNNSNDNNNNDIRKNNSAENLQKIISDIQKPSSQTVSAFDILVDIQCWLEKGKEKHIYISAATVQDMGTAFSAAAEIDLQKLIPEETYKFAEDEVLSEDIIQMITTVGEEIVNTLELCIDNNECKLILKIPSAEKFRRLTMAWEEGRYNQMDSVAASLCATDDEVNQMLQGIFLYFITFNISFIYMC
jgi:hypothetical protein